MLDLNKIKKAMREVARSPIGISFRKILNISPPAISLKYSEVISDLFIWRDIQAWENYFNLSHLGPILNPAYQAPYDALIIVYDADGQQIGSKKIKLEYGLNNLVDINEIIASANSTSENGTFAVFHLADTHDVFLGEKICIAERGFVSYRRKLEKSSLRSYSHGNNNAIAYSLKNNASRCVGIAQKSKHYYRPQVILSEAQKTELALVNFLKHSTTVKLFQYDYNGIKKYLKTFQIRSGGVHILKSGLDYENADIVEFESDVNFLRPVIFMYYTNHFDVLHG